jgi:hypothetical protein
MPSPNSPGVRRRHARVVPVGVQAVVGPNNRLEVADYPRGLRTRFIREIGVHARLRIYWDTVKAMGDGRYEHRNTCPGSGCHNALGPMLGIAPLGDWGAFGRPEDHPPEAWPMHCSDCGEPVPTEHWGESYHGRADPAGTGGIYLVRQVFRQRGYDSPSWLPEPGDIFWRECVYRNSDGTGCSDWDNCTGQHLIVICPNGHEWDIDWRASNCTMREERTHRCWVREGSPENGTITVGKNGHTCKAGAGSILVPGYHGMLQNGRFAP